MVTLVFFASVREQLGVGGEEFSWQEENKTVADLLDALLKQKDGSWADVLRAPNLLVAVNQEMGTLETVVNSGDEVAFFPPVTGG